MKVSLIKRILFLIVLLGTMHFEAQNEDYDNLWKTVETHEAEGLPKSALKVVKDIEKKAQEDKNEVQLIKTMLFKSKFALILEEDAQLKIIEDFKIQISKSAFPTKNILESMLSNLYWQYFQQNRWKFYNRTKTSEKVNLEDFRTWDLQTLFDEINLHYKNSLENGLLLQLEPLENYSVLLNEQPNSKTYRPTLFDFLSHEALEFYKTDETHITKPAYKFEINNTNFLKDAAAYSVLNITSKDSNSLQLQALNIYKNLIRFHLTDASPHALAEVNIERLNFVNTHAIFEDKEATMLKTFKKEKELSKSHEISGLYDFEIASIYYKQSKVYNAKTNSVNQWKAREARDVCDVVIDQFPKSRAAEKCKILKSRIEQTSLQITTEKFLPVQQNARVLVNYKNLNALKFRALKLTEKEFETFQKTYQKEKQWAFIQKLKAIKSWESQLKNESDYQNHTTEILVPKLNNGRYLLVATTENSTANNFAFAHIQVTDIAVVDSETQDTQVFQILNRTNGQPINNAKVEVSYSTRNNRTRESNAYLSNTIGQIQIKKPRNGWYSNVQLTVTHNDEKAYFGNYYLNRFNPEKKEKAQYKAFLFTDRSIYRPGQTVYFKGIAMVSKNGKSEVLANKKFNATLYNVNSEIIGELELTTNAFGSVSGEFILPNNGLNGNYSIVLNRDAIDIFTQHNFSVEEYKRPKFEAKFEPITDTFKVNDSITVAGNSLAYAGSNISNANVVYRVHRKVQYPRWYYWYRPNIKSEPQEITFGETTTDGSGNFEITFKAIPDKSVDKNNLPIFTYEITADVTDINGETRSTSTLVNVGYHALTASLEVEQRIDKTKKNNLLNIETKNLNGEFVPAKGTIKVYKLKAPNTVLRPRPWDAPDYQKFSEVEFKNLFPHEAFGDEDDLKNWQKGDLVFEKNFDTKNSTIVALGRTKKWASGKYLVTLTATDKFGQEVKDEIRTTLFSNKDNTLADNQLFSITANKSSYKAGDIVNITLSSAAKNLTVTVSVEKNKKITRTEIIQLNNNTKSISIPVSEGDLGGFAVHYSYAYFNSFKSGSELISVPYPKTDLEIEILTFRDKLEPGTDETWQFKIKGTKGDKVSAELLASMYDASLDQFKPHNWNFNPITQPSYYANTSYRGYNSFGTQSLRVYQDRFYAKAPRLYFDNWNWFGFRFGRNRNLMIRGAASSKSKMSDRLDEIQIVHDAVEEETISFFTKDAKYTTAENSENVEYGINLRNAEIVPDKTIVTGTASSLIYDIPNNNPNFDNIKIRKNLQETVFFFPKLKTDEEGNISFSFTTPEALTQWKLQLLAHTKTLESTTKTLTAVTQKELMVIPNTPRFLREGDEITISTKIANLTDKQLSGHAKLILTDAISGEDITRKLLSSPPPGELEMAFSVASEGNTQVSWQLNIPDDIQAVQYKILATTGDFSDGEQNALPVLSNRMLVTETLSMWVKSNETRTFTLDKLKTNTSSTLKHHKLTLEMTSNPAWYAVQALPYLMEYPYECNEQTFSRYYANALASHIANSNPKIQEVFNQWKSQDALISNLEKNQELKSIIIQETPWLRDAQSETEQKKRIALLFDLNKMNNELQSALNKLKNNQMASGGWSWFNGGYENRYITQHIISGFGHLKQLNVIQNPSTMLRTGFDEASMISNAIQYLDSEFIQEYKDIKKYDAKVDLNKDHLSYTQLHYLYMRSLFPEIKTSKEVEKVMQYYQTQIKKYWLKRSLYSKGLMALISFRNGETKTASKIMKSLKETSITSNELGMYWKANTNSWYWYQAPIETQALLIEAFSEIENDTKTIDNLKIWLLKNKQTNKWKTTKATTEAVYALLLQGSDWLSITDMVDVVLGGEKISPSKLDNVKIEAGTGYYKTTWGTSEISPKMADVSITKKGKGIAWGSLYWQYFEDLDKITSAETPLQLKKKLFLKKNTDVGEEISEINSETNLKVGDLVRVRIELKSDRDMQFIHMKDMRASGLEPVNVLSKYKWQDGLGYYQSTKDASTNFFFDYLPKGVYVFEYDLRVNNAGNMSNGITTIQSMYAPEFSSHSEGLRITIN